MLPAFFIAIMHISANINLDAARLSRDCDKMLAPYIAKSLHILPEDIVSYKICKRSIDARHRSNVRLLYALDVELRDRARPCGEFAPAKMEDTWHQPERTTLRNPIIVGSGPAGLFAALVLAEAGAEPIVIERGYDVETRQRDINDFLHTRRLNPESNYLFGEGGAGTWSDGKLYTRVHDVRCSYVLRTFAEAGAPQEIQYFAHPHIGSDLLPGVIAALRRRIIAAGGRFIWGTQTVDAIGNGRFQALLTDKGDKLEAPAALIACGHSARRLILSLTKRIAFKMKPFQMGCRIEHPQSFINEIRYGNKASYPALGAAEYQYSISSTANMPGATTFCMCPGGVIIPATCQENTLCTNGMSNSARNGKYANSAIISTLAADTFVSPEEAFSFLERIEADAFARGGGDYTAPAQKAADFLERKCSKSLQSGSYPLGLVPEALHTLAAPVYAPIANALRAFDRQAHGFIHLGLLTGVETRVSSPVRFERMPDGASSMPGLYLAGEGAGMAGGIVSAAIDGIKNAEAMMQ
ncbi:MAG: FAD-dependent monooxygenase [Victivallales bacterium]|nr:FAD-dependent monooxygenase [Victivallales bacterium]